MFERVLNRPLQLYLFQALLLKKHEDEPYQSVQIFFSEKTLREAYPDSLQLSQKKTPSICLFLLRRFSLYQKKVTLAFIKRIIDHFYHK